MRFDREQLEALGDEGWLRRQRHAEADLWIYNYTERTQYENHWTPLTLACRGLILDAEGEVVARPFRKFFNYGTPQAEIPDAPPVAVTEKIDGSLGIYYELGGEPFIATRGSFTSPQAIEGTAMLCDHDLDVPPQTTPLFEIVYPENRVVVDYGGRRELTLLAAISKETGQDVALPNYAGPVVEHHDADDLDALAATERANCEGYVVVWEGGHRVKIKHAEYVRLHRIITGVNARHIWDALRNGQDPTTELDGVPDEIYGWIDSTVTDLRIRFEVAELAATQIFNGRPADADRRELAEYFKRSGGNTAVLFRMLDAKPYDDLIWKAIRPEPTTPDTIWTEEAA